MARTGAGKSISFDRAAADYDRTRALPSEAMMEVVALLAGELRERQPCLEIGVGTGRMALPLAKAGVRMAGIDLSLPMVRRLVEKAGGTAPFPVALADATALPFPDAAFGAALAVHVLHLIEAWPRALAELVRVVRAPGVVLLDLGGISSTWIRDVHVRFCQEAGLSPPPTPSQENSRMDRKMALLGARRRLLPPVIRRGEVTIEERLIRYADGVDSFTWELNEGERRAAADRTRTWARERFGPLDRPRPVTTRIVYRAYDLG